MPLNPSKGNVLNTGDKYGRFTVLEYYYKDKHGCHYMCVCECGTKKLVRMDHLIKGKIRSCGCFDLERRKLRFYKHGDFGSRLYSIWASIKNRCYNQKQKNYKWYGGRGIAVCEEWRNSYISFRNWAISNGYDKALTIDRENNDGNYEPTNCRWITMKEQCKNRRKRNAIE